LIKQKQNLEDIVSTTDNMLKNLEGGIETGIWSGIKAGVAPTWLDEVSEEYDKDASHLINLTTSEIKGPASRFRVALVKKEKPGLEHSVKVNEQILKRIRKKAQDHLKDMQVRYPELGEVRQFGNENSNTFDERPNPAQYPGKKLLNEETGEYEISNGSKWVPYRGEQNGI